MKKTNTTIEMEIPAKALLFGEYGVLYQGKALVCLLPSYSFQIKINIQDSHNPDTKIFIKSAFFEENSIEFHLTHVCPRNAIFFQNAILPWKNYLKHKNISLIIEKSFSPDLGFGSSSAIIAALNYALYRFVRKKRIHFNNRFLWGKIRASVKNVQGVGSGYDIGAQLYALLHPQKLNLENSRPLFLIYENTLKVVPKITEWHSANAVDKLVYGCFVKTNHYSDTKKSLHQFSKLTQKEKKFFIQKHTKIAEKFIHSTHPSSLIDCMKDSLSFAQKQGIAIETELSKRLNHYNIPYKTMGSGFGDCLWVACDKKNLIKHHIAEENEVVFEL